jgi:hypothetical protein
VVAHIRNPSDSGGRGRRISSSRSAQAKLGRPNSLTNTNTNTKPKQKSWECSSCLAMEAVGSIPSTKQNKTPGQESLKITHVRALQLAAPPCFLHWGLQTRWRTKWRTRTGHLSLSFSLYLRLLSQKKQQKLSSSWKKRERALEKSNVCQGSPSQGVTTNKPNSSEAQYSCIFCVLCVSCSLPGALLYWVTQEAQLMGRHFDTIPWLLCSGS